MFKIIRRILKRLMVLILLAGLIMGVINIYMINRVKDRIYTLYQREELPVADCVMALGALVWPDENLSLVLRDRVQTAIDVYKEGRAKKILLSGDHERDDYDEVGAMLRYCKSQGVPDEDIFCDHYGLNTYNSMKRAKEIFKVDTMIISTQQFHVTRAVYIAESVGIDAYGINASVRSTYGFKTDVGSPIREVVARAKDFITVNITKPASKYAGNERSILGDGSVTHDNRD